MRILENPFMLLPGQSAGWDSLLHLPTQVAQAWVLGLVSDMIGLRAICVLSGLSLLSKIFSDSLKYMCS